MASIEAVNEWQEAAAKKVGLKTKDIDGFSLVKFRKENVRRIPQEQLEPPSLEEIIFQEPSACSKMT